MFTATAASLDKMMKPDQYTEHSVFGTGLSKDEEKGYYIYKLSETTNTFQHKGKQCNDWIKADKVKTIIPFLSFYLVIANIF